MVERSVLEPMEMIKLFKRIGHPVVVLIHHHQVPGISSPLMHLHHVLSVHVFKEATSITHAATALVFLRLSQSIYSIERTIMARSVLLDVLPFVSIGRDNLFAILVSRYWLIDWRDSGVLVDVLQYRFLCAGSWWVFINNWALLLVTLKDNFRDIDILHLWVLVKRRENCIIGHLSMAIVQVALFSICCRTAHISVMIYIFVRCLGPAGRLSNVMRVSILSQPHWSSVSQVLSGSFSKRSTCVHSIEAATEARAVHRAVLWLVKVSFVADFVAILFFVAGFLLNLDIITFDL